uniref:alcohol dehydrogenase catalytic domain-containing protein n=1 Tax=Symmachiella dynata TaxID=2527995 RepID=UPI0030ECBBA0
MKAAFITSTGSPECIQYADQPQPQPTDNQVLVKVAAVAVNPIDTYIRSGMIALPLEFPYIIGCDLAGEVEAVGQGVTRFKVGDRVWGSN